MKLDNVSDQVRKIMAAALLLALIASPAFAELNNVPTTTTWAVNGEVAVIEHTTDTFYLGGAFTQVGAVSSRFVPIDVATGQPLGNLPQVNNDVYACAADGAGGWFIGGWFTRVGDTTCTRLAHIQADGQVDPAWRPNSDGIIYSMAASGDTVYVGGSFEQMGGQARNSIAALDALTGAAKPWNPQPTIDDERVAPRIFALAVVGGTVYAGGEFGAIGGQSRLNLAALDGVTAAATAWNPDVDGRGPYSHSVGGLVKALAISGNTVYIAGNFWGIKDQTRNNIAAVDAVSGWPTAWNPNATYSGVSEYAHVNALAISGSTIYAGGKFDSIGGQERNNLAALDAVTGQATAWNPNANNLVLALEAWGATVYAGGQFTTIGGQPQAYFAQFDGPPPPNSVRFWGGYR